MNCHYCNCTPKVSCWCLMKGGVCNTLIIPPYKVSHTLHAHFHGWCTCFLAGWLSACRDTGSLLGGNGLIDLGGSGVVHITSGAAALMGAYFIGPRQGKFHASGLVMSMPGSSMVLAAVGTMFVWFSWYGLAPSNTWLMVSSIHQGMYTASRVRRWSGLASFLFL